MNILTQDCLGKLIVSIEYASHQTRHIDHYYCGAVNLWRDFFRPDHLELLDGLREGGSRRLIDGESISYDPSWLLRVRQDQWRPPRQSSCQPQPRVGRWYPQGFLAGVPNVFAQTLQPMRVVAATETHLEVDCNHPLADIPLSVRAYLVSVTGPAKERGGRCVDWLEEALAGGPGMQLLREDVHADFREPDCSVRLDSTEDSRFYANPRVVDHIDRQTRSHLLGCTGKLLHRDMHVLDLMSSVQSHLPEGPTVTGLGLNGEEMQANRRLAQWLIHDLNANPILPFDNERFDAVCCHLSVEYLLRPELVMAEAARILRPDGLCIISFSNRWFPEKVTMIWQRLHEFERMGYVLASMRGAFHDFTTTSFRNWPRPADDPHYHELQVSDPLYVVTGRKR